MAKKSPFRSDSTPRNNETNAISNPDSNEIRMATPPASRTLDPSTSNGQSKNEQSKKAKTKKTAAPQNTVPINLEEEIRRRAYELSAERGFLSGHETDDWLKAESEVKQRYGQVRSA